MSSLASIKTQIDSKNCMNSWREPWPKLMTLKTGPEGWISGSEAFQRLSLTFQKQYTLQSKTSYLTSEPKNWNLIGPTEPLTPPRSDGLPHDIVLKPHYYNVKEEVMRRARTIPQIQMGHTVQVYADISPFTIQRRRALKPLLTILQQKNIKYW